MSSPLYKDDCRHFSGYRPCGLNERCEGCPHYARPSPDVLLINLDALGDVLRTTALVSALRRVHPEARLTWLTRPRAAALLAGNPQIDRVLSLSEEAVIELRSRRFDLLLNVDKSAVAGALALQIPAGGRRGFGMRPSGAIYPLNPEAAYLYDTGLSDRLKFRENQQTEQEMLAGALAFPYHRDPYVLRLAPEERAPGPRVQVGFNTGCSPLYPYKKLPLHTQREAIGQLSERLGEPVLLLGGPEDRERNAELAASLGARALPTPTDQGLRRGAAELDRCEVVVTGDSLGMHIAIALRKHVVAWFGVTCPAEIDLYDRGIKLLAEVGCAPCWKKSCDNEPKCYDRVAPELIVQAALDALQARREGRPLDEVRGASWFSARS